MMPNTKHSNSGSALMWVLSLSLIISVLVMVLGTLVSNQQKLVRYVHDRSIYEAEVERVAHELIALLGPRLGSDGTVISWGDPSSTRVFQLTAESNEIGLIHANAHQLDAGALHLRTEAGRNYIVRFDPTWAKVIAMRQLEHDAPAITTLNITGSNYTASTYSLSINSAARGYLYAFVDHPDPGLTASTAVISERFLVAGGNTITFPDPHPSLPHKRLRLLFSAEPLDPDSQHLRWISEDGVARGVSSITHATLSAGGAAQLSTATP